MRSCKGRSGSYSARELGVKVKVVTGDQLAIAEDSCEETGRRLGLGDNIYPAKVLKDGPPHSARLMRWSWMPMDLLTSFRSTRTRSSGGFRAQTDQCRLGVKVFSHKRVVQTQDMNGIVCPNNMLHTCVYLK
jgi:hypothetical protein